MLFVCAYASLGAVSQGFDTAWFGFILGADAFNNHYGSLATTVNGVTTHSLTTNDSTIATGVPIPFGMLGGLIVSYPMARWGRRKCQYPIALSLLLGVVIEAVSTIPASYACFVVGKCIVSFGTGLTAGSVCVYLAECCPPSIRGTAISVYTNIQAAGSLLGALTVYFSHTMTSSACWLLPTCLQAVFPLLLLSLTPFMPESPRWLVEQGRVEEAEQAVRKLRNWSDAQCHDEVIEIAYAHKEELRAAQPSGWTDLFKGSNRARTLVAIGGQCLQSAQGFPYWISYLVLLLIQMGFTNGALINFIVFGILFLGSFSNYVTADRFGRRFLLITGSTAMAICTMVIGVVGAIEAQPKGHLANLAIAAVLLYMSFYSASWNTMPYMIASEIPAQHLRHKTLAVSIFCGFSITLAVVLGGPYIANTGYGNLGGKIGFVWMGCCIIGANWAYWLVPELKGRSLEEIDYMYDLGIKPRAFKKWDSTTMLAQKHQAAQKEGFDHNDVAADAILHEGDGHDVADLSEKGLDTYVENR